MARKHFAVAAVLLALAWLCQPFESRAAVSEVFGTNNDVLSSSMPMEFIVAGPQGASLNPANRTYYFQNMGASSITWNVTKDAPWVTMNNTTTGTLAAGKISTVTLSFASTVPSMAVGVYRGTLTVTNLSSGNVIRKKLQLTILPPTTPLVYYKLDETTGTTIIDYSGNGRTGTLRGGAVLSPFSKYGLSSYSNLTNAQGTVGVDTPALNIYRNTFTQCLWVYPVGNQTPTTTANGTLNQVSGLWVHRGGNTVAGLQWITPYNGASPSAISGPIDQLGYNWNDDSNNYNWVSGLVPAKNQWNFIALVVTQDAATIWLFDGTSWKSAVHAAFHDIEEFNTNGYLGWDSAGTNRVTYGYIDEAQEFATNLSQSQLQAIATATDPTMSKATNPSPANTGIGILSKVLHWTPAIGRIDSQAIYLGTYNVGVSNASSTTSQYYLGSSLGATAVMKNLAYATTYYWRVDTVSNGVLTKGDLWSFQTGQNPATQPVPVAWYRLDDTTGTTVRDSAGTRDGRLFGLVYQTGKARGNAYWMAGRNDGALRLDRLTTTSVAIPSVGLTTNTITFTAWIRPLATSVAGLTNLGIVNYGTGTTTSGLIITAKGDLGAMWGGNTFSSNGLIPSYDTWNFVAMSVSPTTLTMYMNDGRGTGMKSTTIVGTYSSLPFDGTGRIGYADVGHALNHIFSGGIDDVRIYKQYLTANQIYSTLETATPNLPDPATNFLPLYTGNRTTFSWTAANAQVHDVFLDISSLTDTPGTPVYVGTIRGPQFLGYSGLELQKRYTFALDESNTGGFAPAAGVFAVRTIVNAINNWMNYLN